MYIYQYGIIILFKLYWESELISCLLPDPPPFKCHYSGISSCCTPWVLLLHNLLLSKVWAWERRLKKRRVLILCSLFFLSLSTLSCLPMCALFNYSFSRHSEPCLDIQDAVARALITNSFLNLPRISHLLKTRLAYAYPHNFTQCFI